MQMVEPDKGHRASEPAALEVRVDADHVDLAEGRRLLGVHLGPHERGQAAAGFVVVEQEAVRVEPRFPLAGTDVVDRPAALLGMLGEAAVVDLDHSASSTPGWNARTVTG